LRALGHVALIHHDDPGCALFQFRESLALERQFGTTPDLVACIVGLAGVAARVGDLAHAARLFGAAEALLDSLGATLQPGDRADQERLVAAARTRLPESDWSTAWAIGRALPLDAAIAEALAIEVPAPITQSTPAVVVPSPSTQPAPTAPEAPTPPRVTRRRQGPLSPREQEVAGLIARGLSNRAIAGELQITEKTAANHIEHMMTKLDLRTRAQIAIWAVQHGLGTDDDETEQGG
jgi:DNA-binding CsgD family transcriptional regulator